MEVLSEILSYLISVGTLDLPLSSVMTYQNRGFDIPDNKETISLESAPVSFVGDIVLANVHFKLGPKSQLT